VPTPSNRRSIRDALKHVARNLVVSAEFCDDDREPQNLIRAPQGFLRARKAPLAQRKSTPPVSIARILEGDEAEQGPFFNYAWCFTWTYVAKGVIDKHVSFLKRSPAFNSIVAGQNTSNDTPGNTTINVGAGSSTDSTDSAGGHIDEVRNSNTAPNGGSLNKILDCDIDSISREECHKIEQVLNRMLKTFLFPTLFHAVPMTMAFVICYLTPTVGLGCCSLPIILVLSASLLSAILLISSTLCSAFCMGYNQPHGTSKPVRYWLCAALGDITRIVGKTIAYLNAFGLMLHCFFTFAGIYNNCYCNSSRISLGNFAYILFLTAAQIRNEVVGIWGGCLAATLVVLVFYIYYLVQAGRKLSRFSR